MKFLPSQLAYFLRLSSSVGTRAVFRTASLGYAIPGTVLAIGHNRRVQLNSAIRHGETDALENAGRLPASVYRGSTMYTTLSPCDMCTGAILLYGIPRVAIGENRTFVGGEDYLRQRGVEVVNLDSEECVQLMDEFIAAHPDIWYEDIGESSGAD